ncbi:SusC/RagA family TonB-linked outer membrane protein [Pedobacter hiemivivus]|nr:SusC/RagA family TonB-linked outer membrane protein [Pedobacter hiemivivus]
MYRIYTKKIGVPEGYLRKMLFIMRLTTVILISSLMQVSAIGFAQKITLSKTNVPLTQIINEIRNQSKYDFFYSNELLRKANPVTIHVKEASLEEVLAICFRNQPLVYKVEDKAVMLKEKESTFLDKVISAFADVDVRIIVTDESGLPLPGATVAVKGTNRKVVAGAGGVVLLTKVDSKAIFVVTYLGYTMQEVKLKKDQSAITVKMEPEENKMDDVVITGIFKRTKESYTGAAKTITAAELRQFQGRNIFTTLGNIDPAFNVITSNAFGSDPNRIPDIQIRGSKSLPNINQLTDQTAGALNLPLIILDGFETTMQRMMDLDNNEIQSITILKDGSATAQYGSRGANGVVVITTKEPIPGKLRVTYRVGLNLSVPDLESYNLLNSKDKLELERLSGYYESPTKTPDQNIKMQQYYNQVLGQVLKGVNTDWMSIPLRTQIDQTHNLKVEGGDQTFRYDMALQYNNINGVMKESGRNTFNGTVNLSYRLNNLTFRNNLVIGHTKSNESPYGSFSDYVVLNPYWEPYDAAGRPVQFFTPFNADVMSINGKHPNKPYASPLYDATLNVFDIKNNTSITNNFQLEYRPIRELTLSSGIGVTTNMIDRDSFKPADHSSFAGYKPEDVFKRGSYDYASGKDFSYTGNVRAAFYKTFADIHQISAGAQLDVSESNSKYYTFGLQGFPDQSIDYLALALQYKENSTPSGSQSTKRRVGMSSFANYMLDNRYMVDFSYSVDGASQFGVNRRFAPFWSTGLGWNLHNESFIKDHLKFINHLKMRATYGSTGSTQFDAYQALGTYSYIMNDRYKSWVGVRQNELGNADLEWQTTNKYNAGLELGLFNDRIRLTTDAYLERTSNLLSSMDLPYANGFSSYNENIGQVETRGVEVGVNAFLIRDNERRISWSVSGNIAYGEDKIVKLSEVMKAANEKLALDTKNTSTPNKIIREGTSQNTIYVVRSLGIDPSTGKELFLNKDGGVTYLWDPKDRVAAGVGQPKYRGNFNTMVRYRNLSVSASFGFRFGGQLYNQTVVDKVENADRIMNVDARVYNDRWKQPGDISLYRGLNETINLNASSRFVQNENTLTCQNVYVSYDVLDKKFLRRFGMNSLSLSANTGELFYISTVPQERGTSYPFTRQFSLSLYTSF